MRADALRNRQKLLDAAATVFAAEGLDVPIDAIGRYAGVGPGTIYRHFPTKAALFEAVVVSLFEQLVRDARTLADAGEPGPAFYGFINRLMAQATSRRDLVDALGRTGFDIKAAAGPLSRELHIATETLLVRAQQAGAVRADIGIADVMALIGGVSMSLRFSAADPAHLAAIVCDGLRPAATSAPSR